MEVQILKYTGPLEDGEVIIRQEHALSKWRKLRVYQGMSLEVGKDIPQTVSRHIMAMMAHSFVLEKVVLDNLGEVKHQIRDFLEGYQDRLGDDADSVLPAITMEAIFSLIGEEAMESVLRALALSKEIKQTPKEIAKRLAALEDPSEKLPAEVEKKQPAKKVAPKKKPAARVKPKAAAEPKAKEEKDQESSG